MRLSRCFHDLGIGNGAPFNACDGVDAEFRVLKKIYQTKILQDHPDKGGDAAAFRATRAAWQVLRDLHDQGKIKGDTFTSYLGDTNDGGNDDDEGDSDSDSDEEDDDDDLADLYAKYSRNTSVPSYEYFAAASSEDVPGIRVELAKSGRSTCVKSGEKIDKGAVRVGSLDKVAGTYGRWACLDRWRVPAKVQNGLTNPSDQEVSLDDVLAMEDVILSGVSALDAAAQSLFVRHCTERGHWARNAKRKHQELMGPAAHEGLSEGAAEAAQGIGAGGFVVLVPGVDGAVNEATFLRGKTFVASGSFPEAGGGGEAEAPGMANVKAMIESFGGKVISRFSKKTNFLLVGKGAVPSKFKDAAKRSVEVIDLRRLQELLLGRVSFQALTLLPALTPGTYQAAGAPPPAPRQEAPGSGTRPSVKKAPAARVPSAAKPAAAAPAAPAKKAAAAAPSSSQALVARAPPKAKEHTAAVVPRVGKKAKFVIPRPGVNGAASGVLDGKRCVLTGVFPEVGGGSGLSLGKDRTKGMIEAFGGKVTSAVSGKTDYVVVGRDPGRAKVTQADQRGIPLLDLRALEGLLAGRSTIAGLADVPPPRITNFSAGYTGQERLGY